MYNYYAYQKFTLLNFAGNTAPYHITRPSIDNDVQIVSPITTMTSITCSLNITIPSTVIVTWSHNASFVDSNQITTAGNTTTLALVIENIQSSDAGVYWCEFNDALGSGWELRRNIRLFITSNVSLDSYVHLYVYIGIQLAIVCNYLRSEGGVHVVLHVQIPCPPLHEDVVLSTGAIS